MEVLRACSEAVRGIPPDIDIATERNFVGKMSISQSWFVEAQAKFVMKLCVLICCAQKLRNGWKVSVSIHFIRRIKDQVEKGDRELRQLWYALCTL